VDGKGEEFEEGGKEVAEEETASDEDSMRQEEVS
jgi:hypothetical protein